jgi:hypothetical protein
LNIEIEEILMGRGSEQRSMARQIRSTARQISQKEQNSSVCRQPVRCPLSLVGIALDG